jgi:hypothetical protein
MNRREKLEALLEGSPEDSFLHYALAMQLASEGEEEQARLRLQSLVERDPQYVPAYFQWGQLLARTGDRSQTESVLSRGIEAARRGGDDHAEGEMRAFLQQFLEGGT